MRWPRAAGWCWAAIFVAALVLRLVAGWWWQERLPAGAKFGFGDSEGYWELGRTIARGQAYQYGDMKIFRTPGYPAVLAPLFWLADGALPRVDAGAKHVHGEPPVMWGRVLSAVLSTAAVGGVGALAWLLFGQRTGLVAAALAAVYPEAIALGAFVLSEAPFAPLMLLHLILWTLAWRPAWRR
jgi:hypothetical protein